MIGLVKIGLVKIGLVKTGLWSWTNTMRNKLFNQVKAYF